MATQPQVGELIDGRYQITKRIAQGGMATVYQATDVKLERPVAVKIMHVQLAQGPHRDQFIERFHREARSAAKISNPHIVQVYDTGSYQGLEYLVMEYVHGVTLRQELERRGTCTIRETLRIVDGMLEGLAAAHAAGIIHRDMKPENIMLTDRGRVRITDFGLAKATSQATLATTGMLLGTAGYLAPEMIEYNQATAQGDIYAVGIMAWEMLTGKLPFQSESTVTVMFKHVHEDIPALLTLDTRIPESVSTLISTLAARKIEDRPQDGAVALSLVRSCMQSLTPQQLAMRLGDDGEHYTSLLPKPPMNQLPESANAAVATTATQYEAVPNSLTQAERIPSEQMPSADSTTPQSAGTINTPEQATQVIADADSNTQLLSTSVSDASVQGDGNSKSKDTGKDQKKSKKRAIIISIISVILAAGVISGGVWWWTQYGPGSYWQLPAATDITCVEDKPCSLAGASWKEYQATLKVADIPYELKQDYSDTIKKGHIITSSPEYVGDHINKHHGKLVVTVSQGVAQATIPEDITQLSSANNTKPLDALKKAGFTNIVHDESDDQYSLEYPQGALISITPEPGTTLNHNEQVTVVLSLGPKPVSMPDITGKTWDEAQAALQEAQLKAETSEEFSDSVPAGTVISTSEHANAQLHWGDTVKVTLSKGPQTAHIPENLVGKNEKQVTQTLEQLGFKVTTNRVLGGIFGTVREISVDGKSYAGGGDVRLRDTNGNPTTITLTIV